MKRRRWYIINQSNSKFYEIWKWVVMISAVVNSIWTPFTISFQYAIKYDNDRSTPIYWLDNITNLVFILDIFINFMTSYKDKVLGAEVFNPRAIAINYIKTEFPLDFISTLQLRSIGENWFGITSQIYIDLADMC